MNFLSDASLRPTLNAAISAGNPELFLLIVMLEAYRQKTSSRVILNALQPQVLQANHPVLITLVALLLNDPNLSLADTPYVIRHRIDRCLSYFPKFAERLQFKRHHPIPIINGEMITLVRPELITHFIMSYLGEETWDSEDSDVCNHFKLSKQNCGLALEQYFFHFGMQAELATVLHAIPIAHREGTQLNRWIGLLSAAGQCRPYHMKLLLNYPSKLTPNLLQQFALQPDNYNLAVQLTQLQHPLPFPELNSIPFDPSHIATLTAKANTLRETLCKDFPKISYKKINYAFIIAGILLFVTLANILFLFVRSNQQPVMYDILGLGLETANLNRIDNIRYYSLSKPNFFASKITHEKVELIPLNSLHFRNQFYRQNKVRYGLALEEILKKLRLDCLFTYQMKTPLDMNPFRPQCYEFDVREIVRTEEHCHTLIMSFTHIFMSLNFRAEEQAYIAIMLSFLVSSLTALAFTLPTVACHYYATRFYERVSQKQLKNARQQYAELAEQLFDLLTTLISATKNHHLKSSTLYQACNEYLQFLSLPSFLEEVRVFSGVSTLLRQATDPQQLQQHFIPNQKPFSLAESQLRATFFAVYPTIKIGSEGLCDLELLEQHALAGLTHEN